MKIGPSSGIAPKPHAARSISSSLVSTNATAIICSFVGQKSIRKPVNAEILRSSQKFARKSKKDRRKILKPLPKNRGCDSPQQFCNVPLDWKYRSKYPSIWAGLNLGAPKCGFHWQTAGGAGSKNGRMHKTTANRGWAPNRGCPATPPNCHGHGRREWR